MTSRPRPATAADVALRAGVSRATVSHILNGREDRFPEETRARVRAAAAALEYRPSPAGRSLVTGRSDTIVVLMPDTTAGQNLQDALDHLTHEAVDIGSNVVLRFAEADPGRTVTALMRLRPLAVVDFGSLDGAARGRLAGQGVPIVPDPVASRDEVRGMHGNIAELQVVELTKRDRHRDRHRDQRRIVYASIADRRGDPYGADRFAGVRAACARRGLPAPLRVAVPTDLDSATAVLRALPGDIPLGVAAYNDQVALAVLAAAARLGRAVPDTVAVVGVDATDVGQLWTPRLTTLAIDMSALVEDIVAQLVATLGHTRPVRPSTDVELLRVVVGETT